MRHSLEKNIIIIFFLLVFVMYIFFWVNKIVLLFALLSPQVLWTWCGLVWMPRLFRTEKLTGRDCWGPTPSARNSCWSCATAWPPSGPVPSTPSSGGGLAQNGGAAGWGLLTLLGIVSSVVKKRIFLFFFMFFYVFFF